MKHSIERNARAIFLPAFDNLQFSEVITPFLKKGGCSVLIGETRAEYVERTMSEERLKSETPETFRACIEQMKALEPNLIVAVDQELGGIRRLQGLAKDLPPLSLALSMPADELSQHCFDAATDARALGVTMFLAPVVDVVDGQNPWLAGRTMGGEAPTIARLATAFITGVQRAGITAVTKHFPGYNDLGGDPALVDVTLETALDHIMSNAVTFTASVMAGTKAVMMGPAPVAAIDTQYSASTSAAAINLLRSKFGFQGLIVSDDLDAPATMRGTSLLETAINSLNAGADLLLVAGSAQLDSLCDGIVAAVRSGLIREERLAQAADRVRAEAAGA